MVVFVSIVFVVVVGLADYDAAVVDWCLESGVLDVHVGVIRVADSEVADGGW